MAKDIKDAIAKQHTEIIFVHAERQIRCAILSDIIVHNSKLNDIRVGIHHDGCIYYLFFFSYQLMQ